MLLIPQFCPQRPTRECNSDAETFLIGQEDRQQCMSGPFSTACARMPQTRNRRTDATDVKYREDIGTCTPCLELSQKLGSLVVANSFFRTAYCGRFFPPLAVYATKDYSSCVSRRTHNAAIAQRFVKRTWGRSLASRHTVSILMMSWRFQRWKGLPPTGTRKPCTKDCGEIHHLMAHQGGSTKKFPGL